MSAIAVILIASFAIDRILGGLFFLLSYSEDLRPLIGEPEDAQRQPDSRAMRTKRLIYALIGGYLGTVVIAGLMNVRLFELVQIAMPEKPNALLDTLLTGLILAAGADRLTEALKLMGEGAGAGGKKGDRPIEISGKLVLERDNAKSSTE
jgi:hypothetical protein